MGKININDIDFSSLKKLSSQGTKSIIYVNNDICIKMLDGLYPEEKDLLYRKFQDMEGIKIDDVLLPIDFIVKDDKLLGYTMDYFNNALPLMDYFGTRYINCKELFRVVKKASLMLRNIHKEGIVCQDLSFDNIIIDNNGNIKYCDIDGCAYNNNMSPFVSILLHRFLIDYRKLKYDIVSENMDRVSFMLSFYFLIYSKELQCLTKREYNRLSNYIITLENTRKYVDILRDKDSFIDTDIPYMDELIDDNDQYIIDKLKQKSLVRRLIYDKCYSSD